MEPAAPGPGRRARLPVADPPDRLPGGDRALAAAQLRLAKIQHELGAEAQSEKTLQQALALHEAALRDRPDDRGLQDGLAQCCVHLGVGALAGGNPKMPTDQALRSFERAITIW